LRIACALGQLVQDETGPLGAFGAQQGFESVAPLGGFIGIGVREVVHVHASSVGTRPQNRIPFSFA
jgi:hypothetical protein